MQKYFITGTDTDVGKTFITRLLLAKAQQDGYSAIGIKPVAAGGIMTPDGFKNEDAIYLQNESSIALPYAQINPYLLHAPVSPHISAAFDARTLNAMDISAACAPVYQYPVDYVFVEGAGGWLVPISATQTMADVAATLDLPVILVVGMRLGCLNHALLTTHHIQSKQLPIAGWIANHIHETEQDAFAENIATLKQHIPAPLLGIVPYSINNNIETLTHALALPPFYPS